MRDLELLSSESWASTSTKQPFGDSTERLSKEINILKQNIWQTLYARTKKDKTAFRKLRNILNAVSTVHNVEATNTKTHAY